MTAKRFVDPVGLAASYQECRRLNKAHGTTYYWSTYLLPAHKRRDVHALYAFCRYADDIVDDLGPAPVEHRREALADFGRRFFEDLEAANSEDLVLAAVVQTTIALRIDPECFVRFLRSMTMDLDIETYDSFEDLSVYMDGSAAVIGEMMLPVLEPASPEAVGPARDLGVAFQLTNFLRDVAEDLQRHRVYLPQQDIAAFGAQSALAERRSTPEWVALMRFEIERTRRLYRSAEQGIAMLPASSARCIRGASRLYGGILDQIEEAGYDVFARRVRVPTWRKLAVAARMASTTRR